MTAQAAQDALLSNGPPGAQLAVEVRRSDLAPSEDAFEEYCATNAVSRADTTFQSMHREIGGWCAQGNERLDSKVLLCDGCPACLFGKAYDELDAEQAEDPKILRWAARPRWLRAGAWTPSGAPPRFGVGERVCIWAKESAWQLATVTKTRHAEVGWPEGFHVPYAVTSDDGLEDFVREDKDHLVRRVK